MPDSFLVVLTTLPSAATARRMAVRVLQMKFAACVNILGPAHSYFWWKGRVDHTREHLLLMKTRASRFDRLRRFLEKNHPYEVPEIVALPIRKGNAPYLKWLADSTKA